MGTHKKQSGGSGQFAKVKIDFSPMDDETELGEGEIAFESEIKGGAVPKEYIPGVQKGLESVLSAGVVAGFPVLGIKATLVQGGLEEVRVPFEGAHHEGGRADAGGVYGRGDRRFQLSSRPGGRARRARKLPHDQRHGP